jgi:hypothetical protein
LGEVQQLREDVTHFCGNIQLQLQWKRPNQIPDHILRGSILRPEELKEVDERLRPSECSSPGASAAL